MTSKALCRRKHASHSQNLKDVGSPQGIYAQLPLRPPSADGKALYYHQKVDGTFRILRVSRR